MVRRSQKCDYLTETDDEVYEASETEMETTIETSFMKLLASSYEPEPECTEGDNSGSVFDTDGPEGDNRAVGGSVIQLSIILAATVVGTLYLFMGVYTYPAWP